MTERYRVLGQWVEFFATGDSTGGTFSLFRVRVPSDLPGPPPHRHRDGDEAFYLLTVRVELLVGEGWRSLSAGQVVRVPRGTLNTFRNVGTESADWLTWFLPGGFERFYRDFGHAAGAQETVPPPIEEAEIRRLMTTADRYGMELAG